MALDEELDEGIVSNFQREMTSFFIWLFREVFAKTLGLRLQVMVLTSNFATYSLETLQPFTKTLQKSREEYEDLAPNSRTGSLVFRVREISGTHKP